MSTKRPVAVRVSKPATRRRRAPGSCREKLRAPVIAAVAGLLVAACGGGGETSSDTSGQVTTSEVEQTTSSAGNPDLTVTRSPAPPDLPDLARVRHGASIIEVSSEYDQATWSAVNLIDGREDRGWSGTAPDGSFVIGLAHPTVQAIGVDTRQAEESAYPGISAVRIEVERATDLERFPDVTWEPVGVLEVEPASIGVLETPDLNAPMLRFSVENGGDANYVEVMEVIAWGELTSVTTAFEGLQIAESLAPEQPNAALFDGWAFAVSSYGSVSACSVAGATANLLPSNGALVGRAIMADGREVEMLVSSIFASVTAIIDPDGSPQVGYSQVDPVGAFSCDGTDSSTGRENETDPSSAGSRATQTPLMVAAGQGRLEEVEVLLDGGADPNVARSEDGFTALMFAAREGYTEIVERLLEAGARTDLASDDGWTALMLASQNGEDDTVATLLAAGADPRLSDDTHWTALHSAAGNNHMTIVEQLVAAGAAVDPTDSGYTPLTVAAQFGHELAAIALLDAGANPEGAPESGPTPLYMAAQEGHASTVELLIAAGASPNNSGAAARPAVVMAAENGHDEVIRVLGQAGADLDISADDGETALHRAAHTDSGSTVRLLLELGADATAANSDGETPLDVALRRNSTEAIEALQGG